MILFTEKQAYKSFLYLIGAFLGNLPAAFKYS
jgi:hypothetical protein